MSLDADGAAGRLKAFGLRLERLGRVLSVSDAAFPYLVLQQGALDGFKADRTAWERAYCQQTMALLGEIAPHLPAACARVLDVGGGMGGIDALIGRTYDTDVEITILDGVDDPPVMRRHAETFNDARIALDFLAANGVSAARFVPASSARLLGTGPFDLVVSFASWCFHYGPETYLEAVKAACAPGAVLILDVRRGKPSWLGDLFDAFGSGETISRHGKFDRLKFVAP